MKTQHALIIGIIYTGSCISIFADEYSLAIWLMLMAIANLLLANLDNS